MTWLLVPGLLLQVFSTLPYLIGTIKGKIKPRISSWATWALIGSIAAIVAFSEGAYTTALILGLSTLGEILIIVFAIKNGDKTYTKLDAFCQAVSLSGIIFWLISDSVLWALIFQMIADIFASIPTYYHAWVAPFEEAWLPFILFGLGFLLSTLTIKNHNFTSLAFPIYFILISSSLGFLILIRQRVKT